MAKRTNTLLLIIVMTLPAWYWASNDALADAAQEICDSFEEPGNAGRANAQVEIANCYIYGYGREKDFGEAERWLVQAIENGSDVAPVSLAALILFKIADEARYAESVEMLRAPASEGNAKAAFALSLAYRNGMGVPADAVVSNHLLDRAASKDHLVANFVVFSQLVIGERRPGREHGVDYWRNKLHELIASNGMISIEDFKGKVIADDLLTGFIFSRSDIEKILAEL